MKTTADSVKPNPIPHKVGRPSICEAEPAALKRWLDQLPHDNLGESAARTYEAITELNQCQLQAKLRFQLLEIIRPVIHSICESLSVYLRAQPAVLAPIAYKVLQLTQQIQTELARGYELLIEPMATRPRRYGLGLTRIQKKRQELVATALHRALNERTRCLFRCQLLYTDIGTDQWQPIHHLYRKAFDQKLQHSAFADRVGGNTCPMSIEQCYIKALLLDGLHANQLRQEDLLQAFEYMPEWVMLTELAPYSQPDEDQLVVDLDSSKPPVFSSATEAPADPMHWRLLLVDKLLYHLGEQLANDAHNTLSDNLVKRLLISWGSNTPRILPRLESHETLSVCVGLVNLHFFSAGKVHYHDFLNGTSSLARPSSGHGATGTSTSEAGFGNEHSHCCYEIRAVNVSQGGYGLAWPEQASERVHNGDILGIRIGEYGTWGIGMVSWLRRSEGQPTQLGVQLLGPSVQPFGAREAAMPGSEASESGEYHRVLFLPAIVPINQPASLITPAQLFREGTHLILVQQGRKMEVCLSRLLTEKGSFHHFEVEVISQPWIEAQHDFNDLGDSLTADWPAL